MTKRLQKIQAQRYRRAHRVRARFTGTPERPRLHVSITNQHVSAQVIDDENHKTLVSVSTVGKKLDAKVKTKTEKAAWVGSEIAKAAKAKKIKTVVFDRGSKLYHGRVKALADAAREAGMEL